ncbi:MAG: response regulator [Magnetococcales bacterium]|nr:response regulator [Magnetococcales bacterium]MBF0308017.1 response regulator [Magnetococcales bacterium]
MKIMIADDELNNRILLERILSPYGECDFVINGREAIEAFELAMMDNKPYDLICLDIMMPEVDGQEALKTMRDMERGGRPDGKETIIFMVSALDTEEQVVKAFFRGGCSDYLAKPITRDKVLDKLRQYRLIPE